jgi:threonylcarbamoyladenosine tRNA methylthiotransferase MtaB
MDLTGLIKRIIEIKDLGRVRISSISITEVGDELVELMAGTGKVCKHLHISLQSGCDKILKSMNRPYDTEFFRQKVKKIREAIPDIAITTDVIIGFPGETEDDFAATLDFCREMEFSKIHVFPFSAHEKTPAAKMAGRVDAKEMAERAKKLNSLSREMESAYKKNFKGRELDVVVDNRVSDGKSRGKTEFYFDVEFKTGEDERYNHEDLVGKIVRVKDWI